MRQSSTIDRRSFFKAASGFAGLTAAAGSLLSLGRSMPGALARSQTPTPEPLIQPPEIRSANGVLETTITAAPGPVRIGDFSFAGLLYDGVYVPPTLRARLGDTMRITFRNNLGNLSGLNQPGYIGPICTGAGTPSNLHFHGMSVSPQRNSDNVFIHVHAGESFQYEVRIPAHDRQGPGTFWYHPHAHGVVNEQILGGMSGGLVIDGSEQLYPFLNGLPERLLLIKHAEVRRQPHHLDQRATQSGDRNASRRDAILAHRSHRCVMVYQSPHRRHAALCRRHRRPSPVAAA